MASASDDGTMKIVGAHAKLRLQFVRIRANRKGFVTTRVLTVNISTQAKLWLRLCIDVHRLVSVRHGTTIFFLLLNLITCLIPEHCFLTLSAWGNSVP